MDNIARIGDTISHGGSIISSSENCATNERGIARIGDTVICDIHGTQTIIGGSNNVECNGLSIARIGDLISCGATITSGSEDTYN